MSTLQNALPDVSRAVGMRKQGAWLKGAGRCADSPAGKPAWRCACEVCRTSAASAPAYFARAFGEPSHFAATREEIADSLGFCPRHGADLMLNGSLQWGMAQVFQGVVPRVLPFLSEQRFGEDKFQQVYFWARDACPACVYERRAAGRHAALLGRQHFGATTPSEASRATSLCIQHFHVLARSLKSELRMPALAHYIQWLDRAAQAVEDLVALGLPRDATVGELPALAQALQVIGRLPEMTVAPEPSAPLAEALRACSGFEQAIAWAGACPVCVEVERARQRWLATLPLAVSYHLDDRLFFPVCPEHVSTLARLGDTALTAAGVAYALRVTTESVHQQLRALVQAAETESERAAARIARWGRRPRRRKKSEAPKTPVRRIARCAACERLAIAEMHATGTLLGLLHSGKHRHAFEGGYGLCMKHHAQAYLLAPKGPVRSLLAGDQMRRLSELLYWFEHEACSFVADETIAAPGNERMLALRRFCGFG